MWNLFVIRKENLLESRSPWPGRLRDSSNGLWEILTFKLFPRIINVYNQRKRWRVNFQDHHRGASRSQVKYQAQAIWNNSSNNHRWGQEEGMDVATAMLDWKTVGFFFLKISKSVACKSLTSAERASRTRPGRVLASLPSLALCLISASF